MKSKEVFWAEDQMIKYFTSLKRIDVTFRDVFIEIICTRKMAMP